MGNRQIDTVKIGIFNFHFGNMTVFQNALLNTKITVMEEQVVDGIWPIGDLIYCIHKLAIPFQLTYVRPENIDDKESEKLYITEFLPLYMKCIKTGVIGRPEYSMT